MGELGRLEFGKRCGIEHEKINARQEIYIDEACARYGIQHKDGDQGGRKGDVISQEKEAREELDALEGHMRVKTSLMAVDNKQAVEERLSHVKQLEEKRRILA